MFEYTTSIRTVARPDLSSASPRRYVDCKVDFRNIRCLSTRHPYAQWHDRTPSRHCRHHHIAMKTIRHPTIRTIIATHLSTSPPIACCAFSWHLGRILTRIVISNQVLIHIIFVVIMTILILHSRQLACMFRSFKHSHCNYLHSCDHL